MTNAFTDLVVARKIEKVKADIAGTYLPGSAAGATDGQVATWDAGQGKFVPETPAAGGSAASAFSLISGSYATFNPGAAGNANVGVVGTAYLTPCYLSTAVSITELWSYVTVAAAGSTVQLGYYTSSGSLFTRQVTFGTVDTTTTGAKIIAGTWTLPAGVIWLAWLNLGAAPTMRGTTSTPAIPGPFLASTGSGTPYDDLKTLLGPTGQASLPASFTRNGPDSVATPVRFAGKVA